MADENKPADAGAPNPPSDPAQKPDSAALTAAAVEVALTEERARVKADADKAKTAADLQKAADEGRFKDVAAAAEKERDAAKAEAATLKTSIALRDYLAANHKELVASADYIMPKIPAGLSDKARDEAIKAEVDKFAKLHPVAAPRYPGGVPQPNGSTPQRSTPRQPTTSDTYAARTYPGPKARS